METRGETASRIELASANGDCAADVAAVGGAVTLTGAPLTTICVVGPSNWARVTATAAVASARPSVANATAAPCPTGVTRPGPSTAILPIVAAMIPCTVARPAATIPAAAWMSIDITPPWVDSAALSALACAVFVVAPSDAWPAHKVSSTPRACVAVDIAVSSTVDKLSKSIDGSTGAPARLPLPNPPRRSVIGLSSMPMSIVGSGGSPGMGGSAGNCGICGRPSPASTSPTGLSRIGPRGVASIMSWIDMLLTAGTSGIDVSIASGRCGPPVAGCGELTAPTELLPHRPRRWRRIQRVRPPCSRQSMRGRPRGSRPRPGGWPER